MPHSRQDSPQSLSGKEPWLAVNLSMIWPGIGQIYSGNALRGWIFIISQILLSCLGGWLILSFTGDILIGLILLLATGLVANVDLNCITWAGKMPALREYHNLLLCRLNVF